MKSKKCPHCKEELDDDFYEDHMILMHPAFTESRYDVDTKIVETQKEIKDVLKKMEKKE